MPQRQPLPRLEHRADQTIIDLTDDVEESAFGSQSRGAILVDDGLAEHQAVRRHQAHAAVAAHGGSVIDLTADVEEPDLLFVGAQQRRHPSAPQRDLAPQQRRRRYVEPPPLQPRHPRFSPLIDEEDAGMFVGAQFVGGPGIMAFRAALQHFGVLRPPPIPPLNYEHPAAQNAKYEPPPAAREGFTRSNADDQVAICAACEEELEVKQVTEDATPTPQAKSSKSKSRKSTAQHPWWVIKECGHVYCNDCFQQRNKKNTRFPKKDECAVESCQSHCKNQDKWVGIFAT